MKGDLINIVTDLPVQSWQVHIVLENYLAFVAVVIHNIQLSVTNALTVNATSKKSNDMTRIDYYIYRWNARLEAQD